MSKQDKLPSGIIAMIAVLIARGINWLIPQSVKDGAGSGAGSMARGIGGFFGQFGPYWRLMRGDKPIGWWLLFIPCLWGIGMGTWNGGPLVTGGVSSEIWPDGIMILAFLLGAIVMRGAGCVLNDMIDRDIDRQVERTKSRPLASGEVSMGEATALLGLLCLIGLVILLQLNDFAKLVGIASLLPVAIYPFLKRVTNWPQIGLGIAFNWGALLGYAAIAGELSEIAFVLYGAGFFWTLAYDTIYAHQDKDDDALIGVGSTALALGDKTRPFVIVCLSLTMALILTAGIMTGMTWLFYFLWVCAGLHGVWQIAVLDVDDGELCLKLFKSNRDFGLLLAAAILFGTAIPLGLTS